MFEVVESLEKLNELLGGKNAVIAENDEFYFAFFDNIVRVFKKPRSLQEIQGILLARFFPQVIVKKLHQVQENKAIQIAKDLLNKQGLFLEGPAGVGKTFACIFAISQLMKLYEVNNPLYISCVTYRKSVISIP